MAQIFSSTVSMLISYVGLVRERIQPLHILIMCKLFLEMSFRGREQLF